MVFQKSSWYTASIKWQVFGQPHKSHGAGKQQLQTMKSFCGWQWYGAANVTAAFQFQLRAEKFCERAHLRRLYAVFRYYLLRMPNHFFFLNSHWPLLLLLRWLASSRKICVRLAWATDHDSCHFSIHRSLLLCAELREEIRKIGS